MNQLLFDRSTGTLSSEAFARLQTSKRVYAVQYAVNLRFDGGEREDIIPGEEEEGDEQENRVEERQQAWAHQAGVNALAIDRFDGRL